MKNLETCIRQAAQNGLLDNIAVRIGVGGDIVSEISYSRNSEITSKTLFDMASVTKIMVTAPLALIAVDRGLLRLDDKVSRFFPCGNDKAALTIHHLLTHTMGYGHRSLCREGNTYANIQEYILSLPCETPVGTQVLYSCPGYILLGKILEKVFGTQLDILFNTMIAAPLEMSLSGYRPGTTDVVNSNLTASEAGLVNDYNCRFLGGIAGNAGLFSNIEDIGKYVRMLLGYGDPIIGRSVFEQASCNHTVGMSESRGLGFVYVDSRYSQTAKLFPDGSIGHCGHTGQSVFVNLKSGMYVIILSDATIATERKYGTEQYDKVITLRENIHNAIGHDLGYQS